MNAFEEHLSNIQRLCRKYDNTELAQWVASTLELYRRDSKAFFSNLESIDWWGNIFCVCDLHLYSPDESLSKTESLTDNESLQRSLIAMYDEMTQAGYEHPKIKQAVDTFRYWAKIDVYKKWKS